MKFTIPKTLGACADRIYTLRKERLDLEKQVETLRQQESQLRDHVIAQLPKSQASGVAGRVARVAATTKDIPQVKDWKKFYKYVKEHNAFELMQRRLSDKAIHERLEAGEKLPGVELFRTVSLSVTKV